IRRARQRSSIRCRRSDSSSGAMSSFLTVRALNKTYHAGGQSIHVLRDLDVDVGAGEMIAVIGASGVGKSALLHVLGGLDRGGSGYVMVDGTVVSEMSDRALVDFRNRHVGFVFQFHHLLPEFDAMENVEMPMRIAGIAKSECR